MVLTPAERVRLAVQSDVPQMVETVVEAFFDDPITVWIYPDESTRRPMLAEWYELMLLVGLRAGHTYTAGQNRSLAIWSPPSVSQLFNWERDGEQMGALIRRHLGSRAGAVQQGLLAIETSHPRGLPHFYLSLLGTAPSAQGRGLAGSLLKEVLERCDREEWPAYLETSRIENVRFYEHRGFRVTSTTELANGPQIWFMWRDPSTPD
jgi:GNAT superfamily N-acetyltransferase